MSRFNPVKGETTRAGMVSDGESADIPDALPRSPRYETLTIWRGFACLLVIVYHSTRAPSHEVSGFTSLVFAILGKCWIGVPLFFVISGYCITASADALRWRKGAARHFFWRRFRRIYPPYWAAFLITALCGYLAEALASAGHLQPALLASPQGLTPGQWLGNLTLTETWLWHFTGGAESAFLPPSWTLCYEEQFYFLVGLALILAVRFFFAALGILTLIVAALSVFPPPGLHLTGLFLDGYWLMFASGVLVYHVSNYLQPRRWIWFCLPLVMGILYATPDLRQLRQPLNQSYLAAFSFALLILGLKRWDDLTRSCGILSPLRRCGEMCYSLYLVHWPVAVVTGRLIDSRRTDDTPAFLLLRVLGCVATSLLVGVVFHRLIERRFWNAGPATEVRKPVTNETAIPG